MTAKEMFFKLGYTECQDNLFAITYYKFDGRNCASINFFKMGKVFDADENLTSKDVTMEELKAINKQCEELGWI